MDGLYCDTLAKCHGRNCIRPARCARRRCVPAAVALCGVIVGSELAAIVMLVV